MTSPVPVEQAALTQVEKQLATFLADRPTTRSAERRIQILEAAAARLGGFDLRDYHRSFAVDTLEPWAKLDQAGGAMLDLIRTTRIHPTLALSALARERLSSHEQRTSGAHYTDFRLATYLGHKAASLNPQRRAIVDPSSGAGILLAATVIATCGQDRTETAKLLADRVIAADLSRTALRGARLVLASLCNDVGALRSMTERWHIGDSLMRPIGEWQDAAPDGYGVVIGNPPWEKLKVHRHEEALAAGKQGHYGADHVQLDELKIERRRNEVRTYSRIVAEKMQVGGGEVDLFAGFTQLMLEIAQGGAIAALLPAGLIRSKGTEGLRRRLFERFRDVELTVFDNKARFFAIDTRFKFLAVTGAGRREARQSTRISLRHGRGRDHSCDASEPTTTTLATLTRVRPDLSMPEVRNDEEWKLYLKMANSGLSWSRPDDTWVPEFCREVDMTRERRHFLNAPAADGLPLTEGRMVHQLRFGAKSYVSGTGRKAIWNAMPIGASTVRPQFWISPKQLPASVRDRVSRSRAGFCDIAGQTNERSMLAAVIPANVVCGNKVPTAIFPNAPGEDSLHLWCAMVNSLAFDWLLRRVLTTTVNYFLLQSVPLPPVKPGTLPARRIVDAAKLIAALDVSGRPDAAQLVADARRDIDLICLRAYGLDGDDAAVILEDFPSLDRSQPALAGEARSTVTRDFLLSKLNGELRDLSLVRLSSAAKVGAVAYVPSQVDTDSVTSPSAFIIP